MAIQNVPKKERTVGKYIIIIVICSKKCPVLYKTGKNCIKINKKRYRFCSLCRLVSSELDDASSKKNQKKDTIRTYFYKKRKPNFQKFENYDDEFFTQEHYVKRQHNGAKIIFKRDIL